MSSNMSSNISDVDPAVIPDPYEYFGYEHSAMDVLLVCVLPVIISVGLSLNILGLVIIFRAPLWPQQPGSRIHLTALLAANVCTIVVYDLPLWINMIDNYSLYAMWATRVTCRLWPFVQLVVVTALHWILVALLAEVSWHDLGGADSVQKRGWCFRLQHRWSTARRAKVAVGAIYTAAVLMNLWYPIHPDLIQFDEEANQCRYNHQWVEDNAFEQAAWRFFVEYLPLWLLAPGLLAFLAYRRRAIRAGIPARLPGDPTTSGEDDGEAARELAGVSLGAAAAMLASILPISVYEVAFLFHLGGYDHVTVGALQVVCESHLVSVPVVCLALSASMRRFVREAAANKCPRRVRLTPLVPPRDDDRVFILDSIIVATEDGDNTGANPHAQ